MKDKSFELAQKMTGLLTIPIIQSRLGVSRTRAIYLVHKLRKKGFVKTWYGAGKVRVYNVSLLNRRVGKGYTEKINEAISNPGINLTPARESYVYGREISYEEALVYALKQESIRYVIASLALFRKINDWHLLYKLAKKEGLVVKIVALYYVARKILPKLRKMPKRFINLALKSRGKKFEYIVGKYSSRDFKEIENKFGVYIPLNASDLAEYKYD